MVEHVSGSGSPGHTEPIGQVFVIFGEVKAIAPDGTIRMLAPNSPIFADERIVTGGDGRVFHQL